MGYNNCNNMIKMPDCAHSDYENIDSYPIAMAYVPWQQWKDVYEVGKGFRCGTIFPELYKPFLGRGVK